MRQMVKDERDEDIVGIFAFRIRPGLFQDLPGLVANSAGAGIELLHLIVPSRAICGGSEELAFLIEDIVKLLLKSAHLGSMTISKSTLIARLIEKDRRLFELIKEEDHRAEQQDEELLKHLEACDKE